MQIKLQIAIGVGVEVEIEVGTEVLSFHCANCTFSFLVAIVAAARTLQQATKLRSKAATVGRRGAAAAAAGVGAHPLGG